MERRLPFYVVFETRKGLAFVTLRPRVLVRPRESNPQHLALQSSALPTELILPYSLDHMISLKECAKKSYKCSSSKTTRKHVRGIVRRRVRYRKLRPKTSTNGRRNSISLQQHMCIQVLVFVIRCLQVSLFSRS